MADPESRYLFIKETLGNRKLTLANIYSPNAHEVTFMGQISDALLTFREGTLLLEGDFNVPLGPLLDTSLGSTSIPYRAFRCIKNYLSSLGLHDAWRLLYPNTKDYMFFSHHHQWYSSIGRWYISQADIPLLISASIEPVIVSDHHPITLTLSLSECSQGSKVWRFNPEVVKNPS